MHTRLSMTIDRLIFALLLHSARRRHHRRRRRISVDISTARTLNTPLLVTLECSSPPVREVLTACGVLVCVFVTEKYKTYAFVVTHRVDPFGVVSCHFVGAESTSMVDTGRCIPSITMRSCTGRSTARHRNRSSSRSAFLLP